MASPDDAVRLHPTVRELPESGKITRPFLKLICEKLVKGGRQEFDGYPICTAPPAFVGESMLPGQFGIRKVYLGHFTNPAADEAVLATAGGEPHAANFGGTVLMERKDGNWEFRWYRSGLITRDCAKAARRDGRDLLLCFFSDTQNGISIGDLYTVDLMKRRDSEREILLSLIDDTLNCGGYLNPREGASVRRSSFKEIAISNSGKLLSTTVEFGVRKYTPKERERCAIKVTSDLRIPAALLPETESYEIKFAWDGEQFRLQPASANSKGLVELRPEDR